MNRPKTLGFLLLLLIVLVPLGMKSDAQGKGRPPDIIFSWAQDKIRRGEDWRIYIVASDPDGDMHRIYCRIEQGGGQLYRMDISSVSRGMGGQLVGYLALRTFSSTDLGGTSLTLTLIIEDREKNESRPVRFPLTINGEVRRSPPANLIPPGIEKELDKRIAYISIDLVRRDRMGGGN